MYCYEHYPNPKQGNHLSMFYGQRNCLYAKCLNPQNEIQKRNLILLKTRDRRVHHIVGA